MAGDNESTISKLWKKYNETNFSDQKGLQGGYANSVLPDSKDSFNYNPKAPKEDNSGSIDKLRGFVNPLVAPLVEKSTKNLPNYDPKGDGGPGSPVFVLPKISTHQENSVISTPQLNNPTANINENQAEVPFIQQETTPTVDSNQETSTPTVDSNQETSPSSAAIQENTPPKDKESTTMGDVLGTIAGAVAGLAAGDINLNPFSDSTSSAGSLSSGNSSISSALNSNPSGGDSGVIGESQFGEDNVQGKSAIEILSKIYKVLSQTNLTVNKIAKDTASLAKNQAKQDVSADLQAANTRARQNEIAGPTQTSTPVFASANNQKIEKDDSSPNNDTYGDTNKSKKETAKKVEKETAKKEKKLAKNSGLKDAFTGPKAKKIAGGAVIGAGAVGVAMANDDDTSDKDNLSENTPSQSGMPASMEEFKTALLENDANQKAAEEEYQKIKNREQDPSETAYDYTHKLSEADAKVQSLGNSKIGIINDEKYKDSKDFLDSKNRNDVYNFYKDPDYFKKNGMSESDTNKPNYKQHLTTKKTTVKSSQESGKSPFSESSTELIQSNSESKPEGIKVSDSKPYILQDDGEGGKTKTDIETGEITIASPDDIKSAELQQQQDAIFKDKTLTVDEANAKSSELGRQQQEIEWNRINKENPTPGIETVENVSTTKEFKEKYGDSSASKDPLGYTLTDDHEGGKNKIDIQTRKKTKASQEEINQFYGNGPVLSDEELKQKYAENPNFKTEDLRKSASPVTPYNYQSQITGSQSLGLNDLEKEKKAKLDAIGARRGKEGEDDAALDAEGEKVLDEFHAKKQAAQAAPPTATPITNLNSDGLSQQERNEVNTYTDQVKNSGMYKKVAPSTFGKPTEAGFAMVDEVGGIDKRGNELKAELEQQGMHTVYSDKESMDKDLNRVNEIFAEQHKLNDRRNEITATDDYRNAAHARGTGNTQTAPPVPPTQTQQQIQQKQQQQHTPPPAQAGVGISVPNVRNNDSTIRMMEQGSLWGTQGGLTA
jgi:hypothetical protein